MMIPDFLSQILVDFWETFPLIPQNVRCAIYNLTIKIFW